MFQDKKNNIDFMAGVLNQLIHDYNNKLAIIIGYTDLLKTVPACSDAQKFIEPIATASEQAIEISEQLLEFSRRNFNHTESVDVREFMDEISQRLKDTFSDGIEVTIEIDSGVLTINVDPEDFKRAIINLASNANDAMHGKGACVIKISNTCIDSNGETELDAGDYLLLEIADNGEGMTEDAYMNMYAPMFSTKEKNSGMGLSQVYGFVRRAKGNVDCVSEVGKGSKFMLYIPVVAD